MDEPSKSAGSLLSRFLEILPLRKAAITATLVFGVDIIGSLILLDVVVG